MPNIKGITKVVHIQGSKMTYGLVAFIPIPWIFKVTSNAPGSYVLISRVSLQPHTQKFPRRLYLHAEIKSMSLTSQTFCVTVLLETCFPISYRVHI